MIRTFHPVGQGAFYSERHENFNIVYDCGSTAPSKFSSVAVSAFKDEIIDVLFISHFDKDHISLIPALKNSTKLIRFVVIPLLDHQQINLLKLFYRNLSNELKLLIFEPDTYFGKNTRVIRVRPASEENDLIRESINIDSFNNDFSLPIYIESGVNLQVQSLKPSQNLKTIEWIFTPYNYDNKVRHQILINELLKQGFNINKIKNDPDYLLNKLKTDKSRKLLKKTYNCLKGKINENSMLVYSGPSNLVSDSCCIICRHGNPNLYKHYKAITCICKSGCIYTGDSNFNRFRLKDIFNLYINYVGIVQIPHHGALRNFDLSSMDGIKQAICPISHRSNNKHHPHPNVINELSNYKHNVISINESPSSTLSQVII